MKLTRVDGLSAIALAAMICGWSSTVMADGLQSAIEKANADFVAAAAKGASAALADLYDVHAQVMPSGSEPIEGTAAIQKFWAAAFSSGVAGVGLRTMDVFGQGSIVTEAGVYQLRDKDAKQIDHGKYLVVWKREGNKWKILRDMFSTNEPPAKK